ncbi:transposase [Streptomyces sp. NPDC048191]|uniref:transposase n=1 Tax=Streptomyces sp. NPDC048191 TaxID=3155484 RepID=UPI0033F58A9A
MSTGYLGSSGLRPLECQEALLFQSCVTVPFSSNSRVSSCDSLAHRFGNASDRPERVPVYPSDMTDAEWAVVRDALPVPAWLEGQGGQPEGYCHRVMLDAIRYVTDNGIKWRSMPADLPAWDRVYVTRSVNALVRCMSPASQPRRCRSLNEEPFEPAIRWQTLDDRFQGVQWSWAVSARRAGWPHLNPGPLIRPSWNRSSREREAFYRRIAEISPPGPSSR